MSETHLVSYPISTALFFLEG